VSRIVAALLGQGEALTSILCEGEDAREMEANRRGDLDFALVRYESLHAAPEENFRQLLAAIGESLPDDVAFSRALAFSAFDNMKKLEAAGAFDSKILQPGDARDPESFKVRRGKVGGYIDYLEEADITYVAEVMRELDPRFGYERNSES
jgi:sulfotransferase family protein